MTKAKTKKLKMALESCDDGFGANGMYWFGLMQLSKGNPDYMLTIARRIIEWEERNAKRN